MHPVKSTSSEAMISDTSQSLLTVDYWDDDAEEEEDEV